MYDTHGTGRSSADSPGCSRRRSTTTPGRRPASRSSVLHCSCSAGPCPKLVWILVPLEQNEVFYFSILFLKGNQLQNFGCRS